MKSRKNSEEGPPIWLDKMVSKFCSPDLLEEVLGDLHERYQLVIERSGRSKANVNYLIEILAYLRPVFLQRRQSHLKPNTLSMLRNHFTLAFRNISKSKSFSAINILGLGLGMTCFLLIFLWIEDERGVDNFHNNQSSLYSVFESTYANDQVTGSLAIPFYYFSQESGEKVLAKDLKAVVPEILYASNYSTCYELPWGFPTTFRIGEKVHKIKGSVAGEDFFKMFSFPMVAGNNETALQDRTSIAISRDMSDKFFDNPQEALGKSIRYENRLDLVVSAVFENIPENSSLQFDYVINMKITIEGQIDLSDNKGQTFVQLREGTNAEVVDQKIKHHLDDFSSKQNFRVELGTQPFGDQYLYSNFVDGKPRDGRIEYVNIFFWVAFFVLLVACINFTNLATARSLKRAKEIGVRKVVGSSRGYLITQFLVESGVLSFLSLVGAVLLVYLILPAFNDLTGKQMFLPFTEPILWVSLGFLIIVTGVLAGSYPALFLSSLQPVRVLKGTLKFSRFSAWLQKGLVVFQFSLSILLLIGTVVVSRQTSFIQNTHLGYDRENLIYLRIEGDLNKKYSVFKEELSRMPGIAMVDRSSEAPHDMGFLIAGPFNWEGAEENTSVGFKPVSVGFDFLKIMNLGIAEGRDFSRSFGTDTSAFMINEEAVKQMGIKDPVGKWISAWDKKGQIIGVLKDYHTESLHDPITPLIVDVKEALYFGVILIKTKPGQTKEALASLEEIAKDLNPNYPLDYQFIDQEYARLYQNEQVITKLSNAFAVLAIIISCLGLLGLAMFSAERRVKEIGIRKVLGASIRSIVQLFSKDFLQLVAASFLVATPIAWFLMSEWLDSFAYRIDLAWWIFASTGLVALLVTLLTISFQAIKSAVSNPIKALRTE